MSWLSVGVQPKPLHNPRRHAPRGEGMVITEGLFRRKRHFISRVPHFNNTDVVKHLPWKSIKCRDPSHC